MSRQQGVRPLPKLPKPKKERAAGTGPPEPRRRPEDLEGPGPFHHPAPANPAIGHVPGLGRAQLRRLRAGRIRPEAEVDLHGLDRAAARELLGRELGAASRAGRRCVLVIHGRGLGSERGEPVLRRALPGWLAEPDLRRLVLAFCPAQPRDGGTGASYVLLSRNG